MPKTETEERAVLKGCRSYHIYRVPNVSGYRNPGADIRTTQIYVQVAMNLKHEAARRLKVRKA